ncbi:uncharacterized protein LOC105695915 isoform X1 [Orussus abietinus]|uniref:uncharacterized protein LOC105695915 isoform X1 n=1 Tax=Orussus abietinus TaxID=222816 RepID=UPI000C715AD4|nr:uncharacterized protein LOC105695915 isoform X1 [Orussus abietinus]
MLKVPISFNFRGTYKSTRSFPLNGCIPRNYFLGVEKHYYGHPLLPFSRFNIIVPLLISVVRTEARGEDSMDVEVADPFPIMDQPALSFPKEECPIPFEGSSSNLAPGFQEPGARNKRRVFKTRHGRTTFVKAILANPKLSATQVLAQKLAKEALKSPKIQDTFKRLTEVKPPRRSVPGGLRLPAKGVGVAVPSSRAINHGTSRNKGPNRRKRKRPKDRTKRDENSLPWSKKFAAKRESSEGREEGKVSNEGFQDSLLVSGSEIPEAIPLQGYGTPMPSVNRKRGLEDNFRQPNDYLLDSNQDSGFESTDSKSIVSKRKKKNSRKIQERESMLARLMRTTTKDPAGKSTGDQGVEYSEYYSDNEIFNNPPDRKIHSKLMDPARGSRVRFVRQTLSNVSNSISSYQDPRNKFSQAASSYPEESLDKYNRELKPEEGVIRIQPQVPNYRAALQGGLPSQNSVGYSELGDDSGYGSKFSSLEKNDNLGHLYSYANNPQDSIQESGSMDQLPDQVPYLGNPATAAPSGSLANMESGNPQSLVRPLMDTGAHRHVAAGLLLPQHQFTRLNPQQMYADPYRFADLKSPEHSSSKYGELSGSWVSAENEKGGSWLESPSTMGNAKVANMDNIQHPFGKILESLRFTINPTLNTTLRATTTQTAQQPSSVSQSQLATTSSSPAPTPAPTPTVGTNTRTGNTPPSPSPGPVKHVPNFGVLDLSEKRAKDNWTNSRGLGSLQALAPQPILQMERPAADEKPDSQKQDVGGQSVANGTACPTTEQNPKMKGVGEASSVPPEPGEIKKQEEKGRVKVNEYHLLPMTTIAEAVAQSHPTPANFSAMVNETKAVASEILNKVIDELEELKIDRTKTEQKEGEYILASIS